MSQTKAQLIVGSSAQDVTFDDATVNSINGGPISGNRNRIINGDMRIDQRNAGASVTSNGVTYTLDRWQAYSDVGSKYTVQRSTDAPAGFTNSLLATSSSAYTVGTNEAYGLLQYIEGFNTADLNFGAASASTVTLSFWVKSSLTGTFGGSLVNNGFTRSYPFAYTINAANTWEQKKLSIAGDTTGTWLTNSNTGIGVALILGCGSGKSGTANSWTGTNLVFAPTGSTSIVATNGATFYLTGVQLEAGTVATPFERRSYGQELALCQRYCYAMGRADAYNTLGYGFAVSTTTVHAPVTFPVTMRTTTTALTVSGPFSVSDGATGVAATSLAIVANQNSPNIVTLQAIVASGLTQFKPYRIETALSTAAYAFVSAEL